MKGLSIKILAGEEYGLNRQMVQIAISELGCKIDSDRPRRYNNRIVNVAFDPCSLNFGVGDNPTATESDLTSIEKLGLLLSLYNNGVFEDNAIKPTDVLTYGLSSSITKHLNKAGLNNTINNIFTPPIEFQTQADVDKFNVSLFNINPR